MVQGLDVPIIPVYLDRLWGSIFSFKQGRFFWKWPERIPYPVTVSFGKPMTSGATAEEVRQAVMELGSEAMQYRRTQHDSLHHRFIKTAKRRWFSPCVADSSGTELTYGKTLVASLLFSRWIKMRCKEDSMVGLMLPPYAGGAVANIAVLLGGKVPVNLNFTLGGETMASAVEQCGIRTILTSRLFLSKAKLEEMEGMAFIEDAMREIHPLQKATVALLTFLLPARLIRLLFASAAGDPSRLATVIFSSGSTGEPKGVMLSHNNIVSNVEAIAQVVGVSRKDRLMGVLPFFHSFGFTVTLWFPLLSGFSVVFHANPLDAKTVGEMVAKHKATMLVGTPTFFGAYLRRCSSEEFSSLRYALVGAEKLREPLAQAFREKYGLELFEGYGCTELSPVVSANIPNVKHGSQVQIGFKLGTVGHPIPGVAVKVVDPDTGKPLASGEEGLLLVRGPNVMLGYLGKPEKTKEVLQEGWYVTGDIASVDEEGFIRITDRLSRFSKIGGEMVPHIKIEEEVNRILGDQGCVVTAVPDEQKGERLVVLHTRGNLTPEELWAKLNQTNLPKLWLPKRENLYQIEAIPVLGTGKVDLRKAKMIAMERAARESGS
jgi:acyl-[acyl-carrier-protein]-phospholipid O-acyltransferase/long-chain-fatty-acid--[acyl-carrier-protein] ligase